MNVITDTINVLFLISCICLLISIILMSIRLQKYFKFKQQSLQNDIDYRRLESENKNKTVEYSNKVLELLRSIVGQIAVLKFRSFEDSHDMTKITLANVQSLVSDISTMANNSLNMNNIFLDDTFFTRKFVEQYIVETAMILTKEMVDKSIMSNSNLNDNNEISK
jgi:hypothetical protein